MDPATHAGPACAMGCFRLRSSFKAPCASSSKAPIQVVRCRPSPTPAGEKEMVAAGISLFPRHLQADTEAGPRRACLCAASKRSAMQASDLLVSCTQVCPSTSNICRLPRHAQSQTAHRSTILGTKKGRRLLFYSRTLPPFLRRAPTRNRPKSAR